MTALDAYVGIPFREKGRARWEGCDCWGLLRLVYMECLGVELPSYDERYVSTADRHAIGALIAGELAPWTRVMPGAEQALDAVLLREAGVPRHVGVVVERGRLLHVEPGIAAVIQSYRTGPIGRRVMGFYRYAGAR